MKPLLLAFCLLLSPLYGKRKTTNLTQLLAGKHFQLQLISTGAYQEDCLQLIAKYTGPDSIELRMQPGLRFNSLTETEQDLVLTAAPGMKMGKNTEVRMILRAFCCQASMRGPSRGGRYELAKQQDTSMQRLAGFLHHRRYNTPITQQAIWVLSDGRPLASIPDSTESLQSLRVLLSRLSGQKIPWYHLESVSGQYQSGHLYTYARSLTATVFVSNPQNDYVQLTILTAEGVPCVKILRHWLKAGENMPYELQIPLLGLAAGRYEVVLEGKGGELFREGFHLGQANARI